MKILINLIEFSTEGGGGATYSTKVIDFALQIKTPQTEPNALKHEINQ
jgi:hypothetical protein